jgi:ABC-2 type transport system permease protein
VTGPMAFLMLLAIPALTMRLLADEVRMGTMELLLTAPVREYELVVGKWLGAFLFMLTLIAASLVFPLMMQQVSDPGIDQMLMMSGYLGVILLTAAFLGPLAWAFQPFLATRLRLFCHDGHFYNFVVADWRARQYYCPGGSDIFRYLDMSAHFYQKFQ